MIDLGKNSRDFNCWAGCPGSKLLDSSQFESWAKPSDEVLCLYALERFSPGTPVYYGKPKKGGVGTKQVFSLVSH